MRSESLRVYGLTGIAFAFQGIHSAASAGAQWLNDFSGTFTGAAGLAATVYTVLKIVRWFRRRDK